MYLDDLINNDLIEKIKNSEGIELEKYLADINDLIVKSLGDNAEKDIAEFSDEQFKQKFIGVLKEKARQESNVDIRSMLINYILFTTTPESGVDLANEWLEDILTSIQKQALLLNSLLTTIERSGNILNWDIAKKKSYFCDRLVLVARDYLEKNNH